VNLFLKNQLRVAYLMID